MVVARERGRLDALARLGPFDASSVALMDRLARLASDVLETALALVCLVEVDRQVFLGAYGLPEKLLVTRRRRWPGRSASTRRFTPALDRQRHPSAFRPGRASGGEQPRGGRICGNPADRSRRACHRDRLRYGHRPARLDRRPAQSQSRSGQFASQRRGYKKHRSTTRRRKGSQCP